MHKVTLVYFKNNGSFYSTGDYDTEETVMYKIYDEVVKMKKENKLPGITGNDFIIYIEVISNNSYPMLILNN